MGSSYPTYSLCDSNRGWHGEWFYIRNPAGALFPAFTGRRPVKQKSWSWGCAHTERHKVEVIEEELQKLVRDSLDGVQVFHTLYHHWVAPLAERTHPMWKYDGRSDPDRELLEELPDDEIWSRIGRVLQLRPNKTVVRIPIPFNASIVPSLVCSLLCSCFFLFPSSFLILVHLFHRGLGGTSPSRTFPRGRWARPGRPPRRMR